MTVLHGLSETHTDLSSDALFGMVSHNELFCSVQTRAQSHRTSAQFAHVLSVFVLQKLCGSTRRLRF